MKEIAAIGEILFDVYSDKKRIGGAPFNFIYHIINLTGSGNFISRIGDDDLGKEIIYFIKHKNISLRHIQIDKKHSTGIARPKLNNLKIPEWEILTGSAYDFINLQNEINFLIEQNTSCLYFGTLAQRNGISRHTIQSLFNKNIKYFCDLNIRQNFYSKEIIIKSLEAADVLKLNEDELKLVNQLIIKENFEIEKTSEKLKNDFNLDLLCVTCGEEGSVLFYKNDKHEYNTKINKNEIVDTVGAGDAFAAILCIGYLENWDIEKINITASEFAAEIVKINGALPDNNFIYEKFKEKIINAKDLKIEK